MGPNSILDNSDFIIDPFRKFSDIIIEKRTSEEIFELVLNELLSYFKDIKEHRSIYDVDEVIKKINKDLYGKDLEVIDKDSIEEETERILDSLENLIEKNSEKIEKTIQNPLMEKMMNYWISNLAIIVEILSESLRAFKIKERWLKRMSDRIKHHLLNKLLDLFKAIFLVLFRIVEQIYMIYNGQEFDPDDEINFLIEDVVYLENIHRKVLDAFN